MTLSSIRIIPSELPESVESPGKNAKHRSCFKYTFKWEANVSYISSILSPFLLFFFYILKQIFFLEVIQLGKGKFSSSMENLSASSDFIESTRCTKIKEHWSLLWKTATHCFCSLRIYRASFCYTWKEPSREKCPSLRPQPAAAAEARRCRWSLSCMGETDLVVV